MKTYLESNKIYISEGTTKDIINVIKGLNLLNQTATKIIIQHTFNFDTKYYYNHYTEDTITTIYRALRYETEVILKNNRLYYNDIILPKESIQQIEIYFKEV